MCASLGRWARQNTAAGGNVPVCVGTVIAVPVRRKPIVILSIRLLVVIAVNGTSCVCNKDVSLSCRPSCTTACPPHVAMVEIPRAIARAAPGAGPMVSSVVRNQVLSYPAYLIGLGIAS